MQLNDISFLETCILSETYVYFRGFQIKYGYPKMETSTSALGWGLSLQLLLQRTTTAESHVTAFKIGTLWSPNISPVTASQRPTLSTWLGRKLCSTEQVRSKNVSTVWGLMGKVIQKRRTAPPSSLETESGNSLYSCYSLSNNGTIAHVCLTLRPAPCFFPRQCVCLCVCMCIHAVLPQCFPAELLTFIMTSGCIQKAASMSKDHSLKYEE